MGEGPCAPAPSPLWIVHLSAPPKRGSASSIVAPHTISPIASHTGFIQFPLTQRTNPPKGMVSVRILQQSSIRKCKLNLVFSLPTGSHSQLTRTGPNSVTPGARSNSVLQILKYRAGTDSIEFGTPKLEGSITEQQQQQQQQQHNTTQHNTTQHNTTQHNTTQQYTTQQYTTQHNTTQHNNISTAAAAPLTTAAAAAATATATGQAPTNSRTFLGWSMK